MLVFVKLIAESINNIMSKCQNQTIAIIDSGIGGVSVLRQLIDKFNSGNYIYFADNLYMPYGNKNKKWLNIRLKEIINILKKKYNIKLIIIACNTASASLDEDISGVIKMKFDSTKLYFATKLTKKNLPNIEIVADSTLAKQIETNIFNPKAINKIIKHHVKAHKLNNLKEFVLGCTHYELVKDCFEKHCPNSKVIRNSEKVIDEIVLDSVCDELNVVVMLSQKNKELENKIYKLIRR